MTNPTYTPTRELHGRIDDGIHVRLRWHDREDRLWVTGNTSKTDLRFDLEVRDRARALDVFHHPFAFAPVTS